MNSLKNKGIAHIIHINPTENTVLVKNSNTSKSDVVEIHKNLDTTNMSVGDLGFVRLNESRPYLVNWWKKPVSSLEETGVKI